MPEVCQNQSAFDLAAGEPSHSNLRASNFTFLTSGVVMLPGAIIPITVPFFGATLYI